MSEEKEGHYLYPFLISADGKFEKSSIVDFVFANKLPLVTIFTRENAPAIFESTIKKQVNWPLYACSVMLKFGKLAFYTLPVYMHAYICLCMSMEK